MNGNRLETSRYFCGMQIQEPYITPEGIIRCRSANPDSYHEFKFADGKVLYRRTNEAGEPYGEYAEWRALSDERIVDQYFVGADALRNWFHNHGFTRERVEQLRDQVRASKRTRRR